MKQNPKLRYLEPLPHHEDGRPVVLLRDPAQVSREMLVVSPELFALMTLLDGERSVSRVLADAEKILGSRISSVDFETILNRLDEACFLDNERFRGRQRELLEVFRSESVRRAYHAGASYPSEAAELADRLASFYSHDQGAGLPGPSERKTLQAMIAPHIDLRLGGPCYTHAYRALAESSLPDLFVILGTGHQGLPELFSLSLKDFETPLGSAQVDRDFAKLLQERIDGPYFLEDLSHRNEHTIEFQVVFLQHLLGSRPLKILPVLVSFSYLTFELPQEAQRHRRLFARFVEAMRDAAERSGKRICFVASVDLAHIGPRYGDRFKPDEENVRSAMRKDAEMLDFVLKGDPEGFFAYVREEEDQRRICGFSPLYTLLNLIDGGEGELLDHSQAVMDESSSFVTFASGVIR